MGMGIAVGDPDNDLDFDFYFSNVGPMTLLVNQGDGKFVDKAEDAGVRLSEAIGGVGLSRLRQRWPARSHLAPDGSKPTVALASIPSSTTMVTARSPIWPKTAARATWQDHRRQHRRLRPRQLRRSDHRQPRRGLQTLPQHAGRSGAGGNWLAVRPAGPGAINRDAIGAKVYVTADDGRVQVQQLA